MPPGWRKADSMRRTMTLREPPARSAMPQCSTSTMSILWICSLEFRYVEAGSMTRLQRNAAPLRASPTSHDNI